MKKAEHAMREFHAHHDDDHGALSARERALILIVEALYDYCKRTDSKLQHQGQRTMIMYGLMAVLVVGGIYLADVQADRQREGRETAISVTCSAIGAIANAGRIQISSSAAGTGPEAKRFQRNLEKMGYPSQKQLRVVREIQGKGYVALINREVENGSGIKGLVKRDGTLDCVKLQRKAKAR